jgi:hypothetical protein
MISIIDYRTALPCTVAQKKSWPTNIDGYWKKTCCPTFIRFPLYTESLQTCYIQFILFHTTCTFHFIARFIHSSCQSRKTYFYLNSILVLLIILQLDTDASCNSFPGIHATKLNRQQRQNYILALLTAFLGKPDSFPGFHVIELAILFFRINSGNWFVTLLLIGREIV